ncbi:periplasmic heavy metal sensor [Labilibacter sediminis]|nr:periplasmic heavy metal sensor [Labilibacter sediminis]
MNKKSEFYKWGFYSLLFVVLTTVVTLFVINKQEIKHQKLMEQVEPRQYGWGRYYREQLNLNQEQHIKFREYRRTFHPIAHGIADEMTQVREKIFEELNSKHPDSLRLNKLSDKIGELHSSLKKHTNKYYLDMKNICNEEQQVKLYAIFQLMNDSDFASHPVKSQKNGKQLRHKHKEEQLDQKDVFEDL